MKLVKNATGRFVPTEVNGEIQIPFKGVDKYKPTGVKAILSTLWTHYF